MSDLRHRLYRAIVRLHPAEFRNEFGRSMVLDFVDALENRGFAALCVDALLSLARQWAVVASGTSEATITARPSLLGGQYVMIRDERLNVIELGRGLVVSVGLLALCGFALTTGGHPSGLALVYVKSPRTAESSETQMPETNGYGAESKFAGASAAATSRGGATPSGALPAATLATPPGTSTGLDWEKAAGGKQQFEVASIRLAPPPDLSSPPSSYSPERSRAAAATRRGFPLSSDDSYTNYPNDTLYGRFPLSIYIQFAYKQRLAPDQMKAMLAGAPKWVNEDNYEIRAKASGAVTKDQLRLMTQALLADRFKLAVHFESREAPVLALTLAKPGKLGPNLHPHSEGPACDRPSDEAFPPVCYADYLIPTHDGLWKEGARNNSMEWIAHSLTMTGRLDHPLVDQTGLNGNYDFYIEWSRSASAVSALDAGVVSEPRGPTFLEALQEQLGMKIVSTRAPVEFLVIDRVERPSEN